MIYDSIPHAENSLPLQNTNTRTVPPARRITAMTTISTRQGKPVLRATPTKNTGMRTEPSAQATMNWKVTSTRKGKHARATMNAKSLRKKIPANRGT